MPIVMWVLILLLIYVVLGVFVFGYYARTMDDVPRTFDDNPLPLIGSVAWPIGLPLYILYRFAKWNWDRNVRKRK